MYGKFCNIHEEHCTSLWLTRSRNYFERFSCSRSRCWNSTEVIIQRFDALLRISIQFAQSHNFLCKLLKCLTVLVSKRREKNICFLIFVYWVRVFVHFTQQYVKPCHLYLAWVYVTGYWMEYFFNRQIYEFSTLEAVNDASEIRIAVKRIFRLYFRIFYSRKHSNESVCVSPEMTSPKF